MSKEGNTALAASLQQLAKLAKFLKKPSLPAEQQRDLEQVKTEDGSQSRSVQQEPQHSIPQSDWEADRIVLRKSDEKKAQVAATRNGCKTPSEPKQSNIVSLADVKIASSLQHSHGSSKANTVISGKQQQLSVEKHKTTPTVRQQQRSPKWSFHWMIDVLLQNPILSIFPVDLTNIQVKTLK